MKDVLVIGGGASGLVSAYFASQNGNNVRLIEKNEKLGKKIYITGKGRCNLSNDLPPDEFLTNVVNNSKFLTGAVYSFSPDNTIDFFEKGGTPLKIERGNRVFPLSDKASDVTKCLEKYCRESDVQINLNEKVLAISIINNEVENAEIFNENAENITKFAEKVAKPNDKLTKRDDDISESNEIVLEKFADKANKTDEKILEKANKTNELSAYKFKVITDKAKYFVDAVIVATGGLSYPSTGSCGDGYKFAKLFNHKIIETKPALCGLNLKGDFYKELQGVSLKNVKLTAKNNNKTVSEFFGEMLFTHFGISGPIVLSTSSKINRLNLNEVKLYLDLKPALDIETLDKRILRDFDKYKNKRLENALSDLLPNKLISIIIEKSKLNGKKSVNVITKAERLTLIQTLKNFEMSVSSLRNIDEAIITSGGVSVKDINPRTMESKLVKNLYFCGEVLDVDAYTGGFNLQIAFSTGYSAGISIK